MLDYSHVSYNFMIFMIWTWCVDTYDCMDECM